jgi:putative ABC transport system permease protein
MLSDLVYRFRALFRRNSVEAEMDEELRAHLEHQAEKYITSGLPVEEAERRARLDLGGVEQVKEECRETRGVRLIEALMQDVRYGLRQLRRNPGFTAVAALTLALGIGANTAIFSVVNAVLLRPLPFSNAEQLVTLWERNLAEGYDQNSPAAANYLDWRAQNKVFSQMAAYDSGQVDLTGAASPERVAGAIVTSNLFQALRVRPLFGRTFLPEEEQPGRDRVVVLSYGLWRQRFSGDRRVLGKAVIVDDRKCVVIGVMPPGFVFPGNTGTTGIFTKPIAHLWMPLALTAEAWSARSDHYLSVIARLKPNVTMAQANAEMNTIEQRLVKRYPNEFMGSDVKFVPLHQQVESGLRPVLLVLLGAVTFVLLIGCANVANLLLARGASRQKEMAVRAALGANRARVVRQLITESLLLALGGGVFGIFLARWAIGAFRAVIPENFPQVSFITIDGWVLAFTGVIAFATPMIFGLAPAFRTSKADLTESLKEGGRSSTEGTRHNRLQSALVVSEVALALVLLAGAGLMIRSFVRLQDVSPGFNPHHVLTLELSLPSAKYPQDAKRNEFIQQLMQRLKALPGVKIVGATTLLPLAGTDFNTAVDIQGEEIKIAGRYPSASVRAVTSEYFQVLGIPLISGRLIMPGDTMSSAHVAVINQTLARWLANEDPIGRRIALGNGFTGHIVGVVGDTKQFGLDTEAREEAYVPYSQGRLGPTVTLTLKTASDPRSVANAARSAVLNLDPDQPVSKVRTMEQVVSSSIAQPRFRTFLLGLFAALALLLATLGIYSVISYSVAQRTHEIGIRIALGASAGDVLGLVVRQSMTLVGTGLAIGAVAALGLTQLVASWLYHVRSTDPTTFAGVALLLAAVALLASYIPARRATKVDPMVALRYE